MSYEDEIQRPWIIAHRGANRQAPENTASAFESALSYPVDGIEFDVQMSADGIPVLFHDKTLQKIGQRKKISDLSYEALSRLDWGKWFAPEFTGEPLITLDQTLKRFSGRTRLMIEIKSPNRKILSGKLVNRVLDLIIKEVPVKYLKNIFILSFSSHILSCAHQKAPNLNYVMNLEVMPSVNKAKAVQWKFPFLFAFCISINRLTKEFVNWAHQENKRVMTWSCNGHKQLEKAMKTEVDAIMTDDPAWLTSFLAKDFQR